MSSKTNIKETAIRQYIIDKFNENPVGIPFRMGTFATDDSGKELFIYSTKFDNDGNFDIESIIDSQTYMEEFKSIVIVEPSLSGDFVAHPTIESGSFTSTVDVLVNIDSNVSQIVKMMVEYVRDKFIGNLDIINIGQRDWTNDDAIEEERHYKLVSNANTIDYGLPMIINSRRYAIFSFTIDFDISKDVEYANQIEWEIAKYSGNSILEPQKTIPLIASCGTAQDTEPFQNLRSFSDPTNKLAKEIHAYVKNRGYSIVFTYLVNFKDDIIKEFYKQSFQIVDSPKNYHLYMKTKVLDNNGNWIYDSELEMERKMVAETFLPDQAIIGEPLVISVGFLPTK